MATETAPHGETTTTETTPQGESATQADPKPAAPGPKPEPAAQETDWKAAARKWEARAKENLASAKANEDAAQRLAEIEEAQKSEAQKQAEALERAQRELAESKAEAARLKIAAKHGIGEDHLDLLTGADEAELEAKAEKLAALINAPGVAPEPAPQKKTYVIPDEGGVPAIGKEPDLAPGMGTLRAAYAQPNEGK